MHPNSESGENGNKWDLESFFLLLTGGAIFYQRDMVHHIGPVGETIVLVLYLGILMGITHRIKIPSKVPLWAYPIACAVASAFMDSFLVIMMIKGLQLVCNEKSRTRFYSLNMIAALIGGLGTYFGEVYMLPLALSYGMKEWWSMLPIIPPVAVFVLILSYMCGKTEVSIQKDPDAEKPTTGDYMELGIGIIMLLITKNPMTCLGVFLIYGFVTGQGRDIVRVTKDDTEVSVMLLLITAFFIKDGIGPYVHHASGWLAILPSGVNAVITGAVFPTSGDVWFDTIMLSTGALITPLSSLVGVMLFTKMKEWGGYMKYSIPLAAMWLVICIVWYYGIWKPFGEDRFYDIFGKRPALVEQTHKPSH